MDLKMPASFYLLIAFLFSFSIGVLFDIGFLLYAMPLAIAFTAAWAIDQSIRDGHCPRHPWIFFFYFAVIWGLADITWFFIENVAGINPASLYWVDLIYTIPSMILAVFTVKYFTDHWRKWNVYQLILDLCLVAAIMIILIWSFVITQTGLRYSGQLGYVVSLIYLFADIISFSGAVLIFISSRSKKTAGLNLILLGVLLYSITNFHYVYLMLAGLYQANTMIDTLYLMTIVLFAVGALQSTVYGSRGINDSAVETPDNFGRSKSVYILAIAFILLFFTSHFSLEAFAAASLVVILHQFLTGFVQNNINNETLLKKEQYLNERLESLVEERTADLNMANMTLDELVKIDSLTGLLNRRHFIEQLDLIITDEAERHFALLYLDLDRFKAINDSHGHEVGDRVLVNISRRILSKCPSDVRLFRIGGDEFAVLIQGQYLAENERVADEIQSVIREPVNIDRYTFHLGVSIGIVLYPEDAVTRDALMKYADIAMYEAKEQYRGNAYLRFNQTLSEKIERKHLIETLLKAADYDREFCLHFQPQYGLPGRTLVGMEALLRWDQPEIGSVPPMEFIPVAEETGLILPIGEWVIDKAFSSIKSFNETHNACCRIGINISPIQLEYTDFVSLIKEKMKHHAVKPEWIEFEMTENTAMNVHLAADILKELKKIGFAIAIDDFGTGYSSLSYIKRFGIDRLKIARELIDQLEEDQNTRLIIKAIIMMGQGMGLKTIAEGVENIEQLQLLEDLGCSEIQGHYFGCAVPYDEFVESYFNQMTEWQAG